MCLYNSTEDIKRFLTKNKNKKYVYGYKILKNFGGELYSPFAYVNTHWDIGVIKSNSTRKKYSKRNGEEIGKGIHVYLGIPYWNDVRTTCTNFMIVKVKCYIKDLIGVNGNQAVFSKVEMVKRCVKLSEDIEKTIENHLKFTY